MRAHLRRWMRLAPPLLIGIVLVGVVPASPLSAATAETVLPFGDAGFYGSTASVPDTQPITGMAATGDGLGYWEVASDGGVFSFGDANFYGSMGAKPLHDPVTGIDATPTSKGYWLAAADGGVFAFGDAGFYGSGASIPGIRSVVGITSTPDGGGYWLVAADGGVFAFGDARFFGSGASIAGIQPVSGIAATPDGGGYWLSARDGGVFAFGDAVFNGSASGLTPGRFVVGIERTPSGDGYWLVVRTSAVNATLPTGPAVTEPSPVVAVPSSGTAPVTLSVNVYFGLLGKTSCDAVFPVVRAVQPPQVLAGALAALLAGPTAAEQAAGYTSFFSPQTAGMLNWAHVVDGVARVDFGDFSRVIPNASSSCGSAALLASLDTTAEQFASVDSAVYSFNGNVRAFYEWLQLAPPPGY